MIELNENHKRSMLSGFRRVDDLLSDIEKVMATSAYPPSPFQKYLPDVTPAQQKIIKAEIIHIRAEMQRILEKKDIKIENMNISAKRAVSNAIHFANMAIEEIGPKHMTGYGKLTETGVSELNEVTSRMQKLLRQILDIFTCRNET